MFCYTIQKEQRKVADNAQRLLKLHLFITHSNMNSIGLTRSLLITGKKKSFSTVIIFIFLFCSFCFGIHNYDVLKNGMMQSSISQMQILYISLSSTKFLQSYFQSFCGVYTAVNVQHLQFSNML